MVLRDSGHSKESYIMIRKLLVVLCIMTLWGAPAFARQSVTLSHDGMERSYLVQTAPPAFDGKRPLVILFHGGTQSARKVWKQTTLPEIAREKGFVLIAPDAVDEVWNDGRDQYLSTPAAPTADDIGFVESLIEKAIADYDVDPARIYVTGASNGGFMSFFVACKLSGAIAAAAPVIAIMTESMAAQCAPDHPVSIQLIASTNDPYVPFAGGEAKRKSKDGRIVGGHISAPDTIRFWAEKNECSMDSLKSGLPDLSRRDRSTVRREEYPGCANGVETVLYVVEGGGHQWPSLGKRRSSRLLRRLLGPKNRDIDSGALIWSFFENKQTADRTP